MTNVNKIHKQQLRKTTCLHLKRFLEGILLLQVHSSDCLPCDIKGRTEQATRFRRNSVTLVFCNCGLKISVIKTFWTIIIVYAEECERIIIIKPNCYRISQIVKGSTRNCANNIKKMILNQTKIYFFILFAINEHIFLTFSKG